MASDDHIPNAPIDRSLDQTPPTSSGPHEKLNSNGLASDASTPEFGTDPADHLGAQDQFEIGRASCRERV